ncbi:hypothetical protein J2Z35_002131 [Acetoanaerobium pronyense]|uniref:Sugar 3,4-ketoisomerase QdtA cupin domain-containing protein n=1 Tax=Acetoanaerobium pronyense TaxID=1482736 RepID=A0ABS4KKL6_9FIRM|nr:FdtA/QdtA family cupin domain-containing protein [Acetoanaerobium pronyense]MBP2028330.1 hypothetical protein [Acetoanaerobium pronyense]
MKKYSLLKFNELGDSRGKLVVAEGLKDVPFDIKRIFYIYDTKDEVIRGQHANRNSKFVLINLQGSVSIVVDDGYNKDVVVLDKPHEGIFLESMVWKEMKDFSSDSILLVLSSEGFDSGEYIRDYEEFLNEVRKS